MGKTAVFTAKFYKLEILSEGKAPGGNPQPLTEILRKVESMPLDARLQEDQDRLDRIEKRTGCWLMSFTRLTDTGPGKASIDTLASPIALLENEFFAHLSVALYDPKTHTVILEASRSSMRSSAVASYFTQFVTAKSTKYELTPLLDADASARLRRKGFIRKVDMRMAVSSIGELDHDIGVAPIAAFGQDYGAEFCDITMTVGRGRKDSLFRSKVIKMLPSWLRASEEHKITKLKISGKENEDEVTEEINLLVDQMNAKETLPVAPSERLIPVEKRWEALMRFWRKET